MARTTSHFRYIGSKSRSANKIGEVASKSLARKGDKANYIEPFAGAAHVLLATRDRGFDGPAHLVDLNPAIISVLRGFKEEGYDIVKRGMMLDGRWYKDAFHDMRDTLNTYLEKGKMPPPELVLWINRAGFNGVWQVSSTGRYSGPPGGHKSLVWPSTDVIDRVQRHLQNTTIEEGDFSECQKYVNEGSVIYLDPPYSRASTYTAKKFTPDDMDRLVSWAREMRDKHNAAVILSAKAKDYDKIKAYNPTVITENNVLYTGNRKVEGRKKTTELLCVWLPS